MLYLISGREAAEDDSEVRIIGAPNKETAIHWFIENNLGLDIEVDSENIDYFISCRSLSSALSMRTVIDEASKTQSHSNHYDIFHVYHFSCDWDAACLVADNACYELFFDGRSERIQDQDDLAARFAARNHRVTLGIMKED